jgi:predicted nucleic acid-binding Zn ribbon protein
MNCPQCGTWNPDDKRVCWRCQTELPKPVEKKKRGTRVIFGLPVWAWVLVLVLFVVWFAGTCAGPALVGR